MLSASLNKTFPSLVFMPFYAMSSSNVVYCFYSLVQFGHETVRCFLYIQARATKVIDRGSKGPNCHLHGEGYTERDIAAKLFCSKIAVNNNIVKMNDGGTFHDRSEM